MFIYYHLCLSKQTHLYIIKLKERLVLSIYHFLQIRQFLSKNILILYPNKLLPNYRGIIKEKEILEKIESPHTSQTSPEEFLFVFPDSFMKENFNYYNDLLCIVKFILNKDAVDESFFEKQDNTNEAAKSSIEALLL